MPDEPPISLTKGSRYRITSIETRDKPMVSHGTYRGLGTIGTDDAICIELDGSHQEQAGKVRLIPTHMVVSVDIVEQVEEKKEKAKEPKAMYG